MTTSVFPNSVDAFPGGDETLPPAALINDSIVAIETALLGGTCPVAVAATTVVGPDAYGAAAVVGVGTSFARNDHDHGLPAAPAPYKGATTVNALGVKTTTGTLTYGVNTVTGTSSDALVLTLPAAAAGAIVICVFTNAAGTSVTSLAFTGMKNAGGSEYGSGSTAGAVNVYGLISDGTNWYGMFSNMAVS